MGDIMDRKNRVFIGGISDRIQKEDIEREFGRFGKLTNVWVAQNPPGFAFVEYDHISEADVAVAEMNGKSFLGSMNKIRVEHSHGGGSRNRARRGPPGSMNRGPPGGDYMSGGRPGRDRYGSSNYDGGYRGSNGNSNGYGRRDNYNGGGGGRYQMDRSRTFTPSNGGGRYNGGGGGPRYRNDSGERSYGGMRNRSRSPPMGGRR
ncbi:RNA recognition motif [Blomia tropicalis]|nr:RNA recognition motif [Blomia tropicalis]